MSLNGDPEITRRGVMAALLCTLPGAGRGTQDARDILRKTEDAYSRATAYDVKIRENSRTDRIAAGSTSRWSARLAALAPDHFLAEIALTPYHTADRKAEVRDWIICGNGRSVYYYRPTLNEYTEEVYRHQSSSQPRPTEGAKLFQRMHVDYIERLMTIATRPQREPRLRGIKQIDAFGKQIDCIQIDARSINSSGGYRWEEKLWIEPERYRVVRTLSGRLTFTGDRQSRIFRWYDRMFDWRVIGAEIPLDTFRFEPPRGAKLVERFTEMSPKYFSEPR